MKKFNEWVAENNINEMDMSNGGAEDKEMDMLNSQMQTMLKKLMSLISRTKNKKKGMAVLHQIGQAVQSATGMSDINAKNALLGKIPNQ
jgi:hypothetical protein